MAKVELIDERVSLNQCKLAVDALHAHEISKEQKLQETELLPGKEPNVWLNVTVKKIPSGHKFKPVKIPIAHPLIDPRTTSICLITKDPQREYKDLLETHNIKFISRVVGVEKLKGKFKPFEARRALLKENGLFLADERVIPLLPKLLGVKWFEAKKQPIPVCLKRKDLKGELERAVSSTYMNQNRGTCTSVKFATLSHTPKQILENLKLALPAIAKHVVGGWDNIQALHIKTNSSVSLPIWSCALDQTEGGRWTGLTAETEEKGSDSHSEAETEETAAVTQENKISKGKKRAQDEEDGGKPKKKAKGVTGQSVTGPAASTTKLPKAASTSGSSSNVVKAAPAEISTNSRKQKSEIPSAAASPSAPPITKKSAKKPAVSAEPAITLTTQSANAAPPAVAPAQSGVSDKKTKKSEKAQETIIDAPQVPSVTTDEMKQKRSGAPGEKKKSKVNATGGKSVKNRIVGKKVAQ